MIHARGIRLLAVVLALTASRNNFPWPAAGGNMLRTSSRPLKSMCCGRKGYDGVVPSRRLLEFRRPDWIKTLISDACGGFFHGRQHLDLQVVPAAGFDERRASPPRAPAGPAYLDPFIEASSLTPRPPPGLPGGASSELLVLALLQMEEIECTLQSFAL